MKGRRPKGRGVVLKTRIGNVDPGTHLTGTATDAFFAKGESIVAAVAPFGLTAPSRARRFTNLSNHGLEEGTGVRSRVGSDGERTEGTPRADDHSDGRRGIRY